MANPVILVVDDEPAVLRAVERELRGHFGTEYTIVAADSGPAALDVIRRLALRETPLALIVSDQRMPKMTGIELLAASLELAPDAAPRPAHRLRGHRRGDPGHQRDPPRPVPPEAVGSSRGAPLPGPRRPALGLAGHLPARVRGNPPGGTPLVGAGPRDQGLPRPQPRAVPLGGRGVGPGGGSPGGRGGDRGRAGPPARLPGRLAPAGPGQRGDRGEDRAADARRPADLRPRHRRRRPGRPRGGGLRRVGRPEHAARGARGARRPGGHDLANRELPRLPGRPVRSRPDATRRGPGHPPRGRAAHLARGDRAPPGGPLSPADPRRRERDRLRRPPRRLGRPVPAPRGRGDRPARGRRASSTVPRSPRRSPRAASGWPSSAAATPPDRRPSTSPGSQPASCCSSAAAASRPGCPPTSWTSCTRSRTSRSA